MTLTAAQQSAVTTAETLAQAAVPFLPPNVGLALSIGTGLLNAALAANTAGVDITDDQLNALLDTEAQARAANVAAENLQTGGTST